ncbi:MAG: nucleotidyl transferase AbiEii/AbiGii toxin family protein [Patescibacteria group bacterium]
MHLEAITLERKKVFDKLNKFPEFYLAGGTALALQIGHRRSVDFDLFSKEEIEKGLLSKIRRVFNGFEVKVAIRHSEQLSVKVNGTKIDFVKYKFPLVLKPVEFEGIKIAKIPEIMAMKAYALGYRGTSKDYVDLYFALKDKYMNLNEIKIIAEKKYKDEFNFRLFLEQLVFLEDFRREDKIEFLQEETNEKKMQEFFEKEVKKLKK